MDLPTQTHLAALRDLLVYRAEALRADLHAAETAARQAPRALAEVHDRKDEAAVEADRDLGRAEAERDAAELRQVEAALHRLDIGAYGDCQDCAEPVGLERLRVQPAAERCAPCQRAFEARLHA
jgi:DnaK suppressor protein